MPDPDPDRSPTELSPIDAAIFDAARACVAEFGVRRTTLTEVARRAGVSRPTVYPRWPDTGTQVAQQLVPEQREKLHPTPPRPRRPPRRGPRACVPAAPGRRRARGRGGSRR